MVRLRFLLTLSIVVALGPATWPDGATAEKTPTSSTSSTSVPAELDIDIDSGLYVTVVDANTIEVSVPDDLDETSEDSLSD
jgi:hypothetical protein